MWPTDSGRPLSDLEVDYLPTSSRLVVDHFLEEFQSHTYVVLPDWYSPEFPSVAFRFNFHLLHDSVFLTLHVFSFVSFYLVLKAEPYSRFLRKWWTSLQYTRWSPLSIGSKMLNNSFRNVLSSVFPACTKLSVSHN